MFKKSIFALALAVALAFPAVSQDSGSGFKPQAGDISTEVQLNLFSNSSTISIDQIRGRYFLSPASALRLGFSFRTWGGGINDVEWSSTVIGITPGIEKHFAGTDRLSPYIGAELSLRKSFASEKGPNYEIRNGMNQGNHQAFFSIGLNAVAGADYYVARRLFLGVEFGFGFNRTGYSKVERTISNGSPSTISEERSEFNFGTNNRGGIRLGFIF